MFGGRILNDIDKLVIGYTATVAVIAGGVGYLAGSHFGEQRGAERTRTEIMSVLKETHGVPAAQQPTQYVAIGGKDYEIRYDNGKPTLAERVK